MSYQFPAIEVITTGKAGGLISPIRVLLPAPLKGDCWTRWFRSEPWKSSHGIYTPIPCVLGCFSLLRSSPLWSGPSLIPYPMERSFLF